MVEKGKKIMKMFFCILLVVIMPLSFVACKKSQSNTPKIENNPEIIVPPAIEGDDEGGDQGGDQGTVPDVPIDDDEDDELLSSLSAKTMILDMLTDCDNYVNKLNDFSNVLEINGYAEVAGQKTANYLTYIYYPYYLVSLLDEYLEQKNLGEFNINEIYYYKPSSTDYDYIEFSTPTENEIVMNIVTHNQQNVFEFIRFRLGILQNKINSIDLAILRSGTGDSGLEFVDANFDLTGFSINISHGMIFDTSSSAESFFKTLFKADKFSTINDTRWSTRFAEKLKFSDNNKLYEKCNLNNDDAKNDLVESFNNFEFLDAYSVRDRLLVSTSGVGMDKNVFAQIDSMNFSIIYKHDGYSFNKKS